MQHVLASIPTLPKASARHAASSLHSKQTMCERPETLLKLCLHMDVRHPLAAPSPTGGGATRPSGISLTRHASAIRACSKSLGLAHMVKAMCF